VADNPRIEELRRRVQADPASIAFAALAEEFRRIGRYEDAIATCRTGLVRHPAYLSARVTLGRALIETGDYVGARQELETVLRSAPENIAATRGLALIDERVTQSASMDPGLAAIADAPAAAAPAAPHASPEPAASKAPAPAKASAVAELPSLQASPIGLEAFDLDLSAPPPAAHGNDAFDQFAHALERSAASAAEDLAPAAVAEAPARDAAPLALATPSLDELPAAESASVVEDALAAGVPDAATAATLDRLERLLGAIRTARPA